MKRLWNLDTNAYEDGAPDKKTKEMPGLVVRRGGYFVVMIVSNTLWSPMNSVFRQNRCMKFLPWPILLAEQ